MKLKDGVLFLAPTGKARVLLQEASKAGAKAYTLAQFLNQYNRYDGRTGRYETSGIRAMQPVWDSYS